MTSRTKTTLKTYFQRGNKPTQAQFADFIDSCAMLAETSAQTFVGGIAVSGAITGYGGANLGGTVTINALVANNATMSGTIDLTGGQIKFPAAQATSSDPNTLDDYEEGTVTGSGIALTFATPGDLAVLYTTRDVTYTKTGNRVRVRGYILASSFTYSTSAGVFIVSGALPFVPAKDTVGSTLIDNFSSISGSVICYVNTSSQIVFYFDGTGSKTQFSTAHTPSGSGKEIYFNVTYEV